MTIEILVPDIGADEVEVTEILVKVGDSIALDQSLLAVEGDKASMEVPASHAGVVKEIKVSVGDKIKTGHLVMVFENSATETSALAASSVPSAVSSQPAEVAVASADTANAQVASVQQVELPDVGGDEVEVTEILVSIGQSVSQEQSLLSVEGDKASMEVPAPFAGVVKDIRIAVGDKVKTGSLIMTFEVVGSSVPQVQNAPATTPSQTAASQASNFEVATAENTADVKPHTAQKQESQAQVGAGFVENSAYAHASPVVRRLAREFGVDLSKVKGSARKGRVLREDVQNYVKTILQQVAAGQGAVTGSGNSVGFDLIAWPKVDFAKFGEVEEKPLSRIQKVSGANLHRNWVRIPHVTQFDEGDITDLEAFRKEQNTLAEKKKLNVKYTPLVFIMKAVAKALEEFPTFNSSLSEEGASLILKKYVHLGIAVDTPNGLVVPVIRDVNKKGIIELSRELADISAKARDGKLTASDMQGGCFTISSLGGIGGTAFTPIVNAPEVAILGVSKSEIKPKWNGKEFEPRLMLPLSVSYDHRVIDGALAARFTATLASYLGDIRQIIM